MSPYDILWRTAIGQRILVLRTKEANARATLGLLKLLEPIARFFGRA